MKDPHLYYHPSGVAPPKGIFIALLAGIPLAAVCGIGYSKAISTIPFVYLDILLTVLFGVLLGVIAKAFIRTGKIRNIPFGIVFGLLLAITGIYAKWSYWSVSDVFYSEELGQIHNSPGFMDAVMHPVITWNMMQLVNKIGAFSLHDIPFEGTLLWIVWISEAGIILFFTTAFSLRQVKLPFSETGNSWMDALISPRFLNAGISMKELRGQLELRNYTSLVQGMSANGMASRLWTVAFYNNHASDEYYLEVAEEKPEKRNRRGKQARPGTALFAGMNKTSGLLRISKTDYEFLRESLGGELIESPLAAFRSGLHK